MARIKVTPNRDDVPPHPIDGKMPPEGAMWTADQYTFRLIRDGDISEVVDPPPEQQRSGGDPGEHHDKPKAKSPR
jgi:hypothetical protein